MMLLVFGYPKMPRSEVEMLMADAHETLDSIKATEQIEWTSYAH